MKTELIANEKTNPKKDVYLLKALFVSVIFIYVSVSVGSFWDMNDDPSIAYLLSLEDNNYSPFQWRLLSIVLHFLFVKFPVVNWWTVNLFVALWLTAASFAYVIYKRFPYVLSDLIICIVLIALWIVAGVGVNFTRTAAVVAMGGCLLIADSLFDVGSIRKVQYIIGCIFLLFGASIRASSALIALGFLAVIGTTCLLSDGIHLKKEWFCVRSNKIFGLSLAAIVFFGASALDSMILTQEQKDYVRYNAVRSKIQDYIEKYPSYENAYGKYQEVGIDNNVTKDALLSWFSEDTEILTENVLSAVAQLKNDTGSLHLLENNINERTSLLMIFVILIVLLSLLYKWNFVRMLPPIGLAIVFGSVLAYTGRLPARVFDSIVILMMVSSMFLASEKITNQDSSNGNGLWAVEKIGKFSWRRNLVIGLYFCGLIGTFLLSGEYITDANSANRIWSTNSDMEEYRENTLDYINEDEDHIYIYDLIVNPHSISYAYTMWESREIGYCDNLFFLGGWDARHPDMVKRLEANGITNPVRAVYEHPRVRSVYSPRLLDYLRINYDSRITVTEIGYFGNAVIVQYCAPIDDALLMNSDTGVAQIQEVYRCTGEYDHAWYFEAKVNTFDKDMREFFCNVTLDGTRYTYRLYYEDGQVSGFFYHIGELFDISTADISIFELTADGRYLEYELRK